MHDRSVNTTEFLQKVTDLMVEYKIPRIDISIDAFSLLKVNLQNQ